MSNGYLWIEVSNVRTNGTKTVTKADKVTETQPNVQVQLKGDRTDKEPAWWDVADDAYGKDASETAKEVFRALDSKRIVLAGIGPEGNKLAVRAFRIQFSDSGSR